MCANFFGRDPAYHDARRRFVFKACRLYLRVPRMTWQQRVHRKSSSSLSLSPVRVAL